MQPTTQIVQQSIPQTAPHAAQKTARNATAIALSTLLARGIQFGWILMLGRLIGVSDFGVYGTIGGMIATAAVIPEFGMGLIVLRDVAQRPAFAGRYLSATLVAQPLLACATYVLLVLAGLLLPYDTATRLLIMLAALSLIVDALGNLYYSQLIALEQMVATSAITVIHVGLLITFVFAVLITGGGLAGLYVATIAAGMFRVALHWIAVRRVGIRPLWPIDRVVLRSLFNGGWSIALANFVRTSYQHVDKIIVLWVLGEVYAGYLTAAFVIVFGVTELLNTTVLVALFPLMSRLAQEQPAALRRLVDQLAFLTLTAALPLAVGISSLSGKLAGLLFPGFIGTAAVLEVLIWHTIVVMIGNLYAQVMVIQHRQRRVLIIRVASLALNIILNLILLPRIGLPAAALATLVSESLALLLMLIEHQPERATVFDLLGRSARVGLAAVAMALTIAFLRDVNFIVAGICGTLVYAVSVLLLRALSAGEWSIVCGILRTVSQMIPQRRLSET